MVATNFQDVVSLSAGNSVSATLMHRGNVLQIGNSVLSTVSYRFSNSGGVLDLAGAPTGSGTVFMPTSGGTLLTNVDISAGTTSSKVSAWTYSNANNVSFGFDGSNITATATVASSLTNVNVSAGTTSNNLSAVVFSNSNNVSFGLSGSTVTGSVTVASSQDSMNFSAGTTSRNISNVVFSNSNGVSFGLNGSTITASVATSLTNINVSAGTTSNNLSAVTFSNSNGVSFGLNGSVVTASAGGGAGGLASLSSWQAGPPVGTNNAAQVNSLYLNPVVIPYNITATNILFLASCATGAGITNSITFGVYTNNASTLSLASSGSTTFAATGANQNGDQYISVSMTSWSFTPGPYVFALNPNAPGGVNFYVTASGIVVSSTGLAGNLTKFILPGYSAGTTAGLPSTIAQSATGYVRDGRTTSPLLQAWFNLQGT